jgi:hypothetical protein
MVLGALLQPGLSSAEEWQPLKSPPAGWTWIALIPEDSMRGVYHDSVSGAFVEVDIGGERQIGSWAEAVRSDGTAELRSGWTEKGVPYEVVTSEDARDTIAAVLGKLGGDTPSDKVADSDYQLLPPPECPLFAVSYHVTDSGSKEPNIVWNFSAATCSDSQTTRVRGLLSAGVELREDPLAATAHLRGRHDAGALHRLKVGATLHDVLTEVGQPFDCWRWGSDGLVIAYVAQSTDDLVQLRFDSQQDLVAVLGDPADR